MSFMRESIDHLSQVLRQKQYFWNSNRQVIYTNITNHTHIGFDLNIHWACYAHHKNIVDFHSIPKSCMIFSRFASALWPINAPSIAALSLEYHDPQNLLKQSCPIQSQKIYWHGGCTNRTDFDIKLWCWLAQVTQNESQVGCLIPKISSASNLSYAHRLLLNLQRDEEDSSNVSSPKSLNPSLANPKKPESFWYFGAGCLVLSSLLPVYLCRAWWNMVKSIGTFPTFPVGQLQSRNANHAVPNPAAPKHLTSFPWSHVTVRSQSASV